MSYLYRILKFALQDFFRNIWLSLATITILTLTLLSINLLVVFNGMAATASKIIENKVDISIDFKVTAKDEEVSAIKNYIISLPEVAETNYISREEALQTFKNRHQGETSILEVVDELGQNPLGPTLKIKARNISSYPAILQAIDKPEYNQLIEHKDYNDWQDMISKITNWTQTGKKIVIVFILIFVFISSLIVFNTIKMAIYTHREEIGIEKLVGATNWFVSLPFILEGIFYALLSCLFIMAIIFPLLNLAQPYITRFFGEGQFNLIQYFVSNFFLIFGLEFIVISIINIASSFLAVNKYLKV